MDTLNQDNVLSGLNLMLAFWGSLYCCASLTVATIAPTASHGCNLRGNKAF